MQPCAPQLPHSIIPTGFILLSSASTAVGTEPAKKGGTRAPLLKIFVVGVVIVTLTWFDSLSTLDFSLFLFSFFFFFLFNHFRGQGNEEVAASQGNLR